MSEWFKVRRRPVTQRAREANPGGEFIYGGPSAPELRAEPGTIIVEDVNGGQVVLSRAIFDAMYERVDEAATE